MGVFHEFLPVEKQSIVDFVAKQNGFVNHPLQPVYEIPRKPSTSNSATDAEDEKHLSEAKSADEKMDGLCKMMDGISSINHRSEPSVARELDMKRVEIAKNESILSMGKLITTKPACDVSVAPRSTPRFSEKPSQIVKKKSKFTESHVEDVSPKKPNKKSAIASFAIASKPRIEGPRKTRFKSLAVVKILKEAKEKRKTTKNEVHIPIVDLKFL